MLTRGVYMKGTINEFYRKYRRKGLRDLAIRTGTTDTYLMQLNYDVSKRPSVDLALRLIRESQGEITLEGICNPKKILMKR